MEDRQSMATNLVHWRRRSRRWRALDSVRVMERDGLVVMVGCRLLGWMFLLSLVEEREGEGEEEVMWTWKLDTGGYKCKTKYSGTGRSR
ncbi:hypothetical protein QJS04_geneDACA010455 [Acorus gramineus]|uniref:Uncharacterized protein n=1 Tax=Acorus gramineus TaxID=55184 RepID=A0AAV9ALD2_ACOGR|nr:hypothetical protein QJS04_geneDACA010455 [Acorus gramineus]